MRTSLTALLAAIFLAACNKTSVRPSSPAAAVLVPAPSVISVPQVRYVEIPVRLRKRCKWTADGALEEMPDVARGRKKCLQYYEANLDEIDQLQGAPASTGDR
ncbi:hypothetical protein NG829_08465 [Xanthomonas sacchari]|uniref:hypothetical protein n=1 Tax=Xanthomonas sacchari TaxID=56458 RepID=UPI00225DE650|nr:hypothetical protein [Xanthomonas sacchari]UYK82309.1 hypothetical protein NG829_08465 [Xanthomonas sacchari]